MRQSSNLTLPIRMFCMLATLGLTACAIMGQGALQRVAVSTSTPAGDAVVGIECVLRNDKGEWRLTSLGSAQVRGSKQPLTVRCENDQWQAANSGGDEAGSRAPYGDTVLAGAAAGGTVAAATGALLLGTVGTAGVTYGLLAAMGPLMLLGVAAGAGVGLLQSNAEPARVYPPLLVMVVEPRSGMVGMEPTKTTASGSAEIAVPPVPSFATDGGAIPNK